MSGQILLISGPSGSGKSTLLNRLLSEFENIHFSISATTRAKREGEKEGVNYYFISEKEFKKDIQKGEFLEWAIVHGNYYGTPLSPVEEAIKHGKIVIFDIDVQGFHLAMKKYPDLITSVFVTTQSINELKDRLKARDTDSDEIIEDRLKNALKEMNELEFYDYLIINDNFNEAYELLRAIFISRFAKVKKNNTQAIIKKWKEN